MSTDNFKLIVPNVCSVCHKSNASFKCSLCKHVHYCSKECQANDWKTHKKICKHLKLLYEQDKFELSDFLDRTFLGSGNFSTIYKAVHIYTKTEVALKIIDKDKVRRMKYRNQNIENEIMNEKLILKQLNHPFIEHIFGTSQSTTELAYILEYLDGPLLLDYLYNTDTKQLEGLSPSILRHYMAELVVALSYLHSKQIAHRDLKPENIIIDSSNNIHLLDFGSAKDFKAENKMKVSDFAGTFQYMSPELICEKDYNTSTDYFSLGVLFYLCLFGQYPFSGEYNGSVYISMKMIEFYDRDHLLDMVPPFYHHHQEVLQLLDLLFEKDISKRKECISSLPLHHLLVCTLDHLSQLEYFNDISFSQLYLSHPSLQTDYEQQVETICKEIINKTRTTLSDLPDSIHKEDLQLYLFSHHCYYSSYIHKLFYEPSFLERFDCVFNHYYYPNDYQQHSYWKEDFSCLFLILYPSQLQDLNSFLELLQRFLVNHHHYRTLFLYIDHINTCSSTWLNQLYQQLSMISEDIQILLPQLHCLLQQQAYFVYLYHSSMYLFYDGTSSSYPYLNEYTRAITSNFQSTCTYLFYVPVFKTVDEFKNYYTPTTISSICSLFEDSTDNYYLYSLTPFSSPQAHIHVFSLPIQSTPHDLFDIHLMKTKFTITPCPLYPFVSFL